MGGKPAERRTSLAVLNYAAGLLLAAVLLFAFVVNFSAVESRFQCPGELTDTGGAKPVTAYIKLHRYRWWVGLWSNSEGDLRLEMPHPNTAYEYWPHIIQVGDQLQIYDFDKRAQGMFSTLSNAIAIKTYRGFFDGSCKPV